MGVDNNNLFKVSIQILKKVMIWTISIFTFPWYLLGDAVD